MILKSGPLILTKELILKHTTEERLMEHYLGITPKKGLFRSPLRKDTNPTCSFNRNKKGDLIFKDFDGSFYGNFISVVMYKFNCSFSSALQIIANDFNIITRHKLVKNKPKTPYSNTKFKETNAAVIQIEMQDFQQNELNYWSAYNINLSTLQKFQVFSAKNVWLNGNIFHLQKKNQLVFGYFGGIKAGSEQWRIYFPGKHRYKFISNWTKAQIQGLSQLPKEGGEYLVITKSLKDCMCLYELGISAIAPISENLFISQRQYEKLQKKFKHIILFYDNDLPGIRSMNKIRKEYPNVKVMFIPRKYNVKDISDFRKKYGKKKTIDLIDKCKHIINTSECEEKVPFKKETIT